PGTGVATLERTAATTATALARGPLAFGHRRLRRRRLGGGGWRWRGRHLFTFHPRLARRTRAALATLAGAAAFAATAGTLAAAATAATAAATAALRILGGARLAHFPEDLADALAFLGHQLHADRKSVE